MRVLAVIDNSDGRFCCLADKLARLKGAGVVVDVVFTESYREFYAYVDVMGVHGGDMGGGNMAEPPSGSTPLDGLHEALAVRGIAGRIDLRSLGRIGLHALFDGGIALFHYDLVLFDEHAPSPFSHAGGNARRLAAVSGIPVIHVRRCDQMDGLAGLSKIARPTGRPAYDDRTALMAVWPGSEGAAALLGFLSRYADTFSAIVIWVDDKSDIEGPAWAELEASLQHIKSTIPVEVHYRRDTFWNRDVRAAIDRHKVGSIFVPTARTAGLAAMWRKLRFGYGYLSARGDLSHIYVGS